MLEYQKMILGKVSFSKALFKNELLKTLKWITSKERKVFYIWLMTVFGSIYGDVIKEVFKNI
jgi:hypothetical protein